MNVWQPNLRRTVSWLRHLITATGRNLAPAMLSGKKPPITAVIAMTISELDGKNRRNEDAVLIPTDIMAGKKNKEANSNLWMCDLLIVL